MKRTPFLAATGGAVLSLALVGAAVGGAGGASAVSAKKTASPTPTTVVQDGPGCFNPVDGTFFWHRDPVSPGSTAKSTVGEIGATVYLEAANCTHELYRFQLLDDATGRTVLKQIDVQGSWPQVPAVTVTQVVHMAATDGADTNDDFQAIRIQLQIFDGAGALVRTVIDPSTTPVPGVELFDGDANTSPATIGFR
jgi:hypothetical protein